MRAIVRVLIALTVLGTAVRCALGTGWTRVIEPSGELIQCFAVDGQRLFAGTSAGVYLSTNDGDSWTGVSDGFNNYSVNALMAYRGNLFAGGGGVFRSSNNGTTWTPDTLGIGSTPVQSLAAHDTIVFAATSGKGVFRSSLNGEGWTFASSGLPYNSQYPGYYAVSGLAVIGSSLFASVNHYQYGGVFRSTDDGASWAQVNSMLSDWRVTTISVIDGILYAGTVSGGVFRSSDSGGSWASVASELPGAVLSIVVSNGRLIAGTERDGAFRFGMQDAGWSAVNDGLTVAHVGALAVHGTRLFAGTGSQYYPGRGIFRSTNDGDSWTTTNNGFTEYAISAIAASESELFVGVNGGGGVFESSDGGAKWAPLADSGMPTDLLCLANDGASLFAGFDAGEVLRSTNGGASWRNIGNPSNGLAIRRLLAGGGILFASTEGGGLFLSTDEGANWIPSHNDSLFGLAGYVNAFVTSGGTSFVTTSYGIYRTTNRGAQWTLVRSLYDSLDAVYMNGITLAANGANLYAGTALGVMLHSSDNGETWKMDSVGKPVSYFSTLVADGGSLFGGTLDDSGHGAVFLSTDGGTHWATVSDGLPDRSITFMAVSGGYLVARTYDGVYRRPLSELIVAAREDNANIVPLEITLDQNHPNPVCANTTIEYSLPRSESISLTIVNALGETVAVLAQGEMNAGRHSAMLHAERLKSGVYECRLATRSGVLARNVIVVH